MFLWNSFALCMIKWMFAIWSLVLLFLKYNLYIWKFSVHVLLKPSLKDFKHYLVNMWNEHNSMVVCLALPLFVIGMKTDLFQFPDGLVDKESARFRQTQVYPWVGKTPWRRKLQPTQVSSLENSHGQWSLVCYSPRGRKSQTWLSMCCCGFCWIFQIC